MGVREQDDVNQRQLGNGEGGRHQALRPHDTQAQIEAHPAEEHGVGEDGDAKKVQQNSGVAEPSGGDAIGGPLLGMRDEFGLGDAAAGFRDKAP